MALCAGALALAGCSMAVTAGQGTPWQQETAYFSPATEIDEGNVGEFFSDPVFVEKFDRLAEVSTNEFHIYRSADLILPKAAAEK